MFHPPAKPLSIQWKRVFLPPPSESARAVTGPPSFGLRHRLSPAPLLLMAGWQPATLPHNGLSSALTEYAPVPTILATTGSPGSNR